MRSQREGHNWSDVHFHLFISRRSDIKDYMEHRPSRISDTWALLSASSLSPRVPGAVTNPAQPALRLSKLCVFQTGYDPIHGSCWKKLSGLGREHLK